MRLHKFALFAIAVSNPFASANDLSSLPWDHLIEHLTSDADNFHFASKEAWLEQCAPIFEQEKFPTVWKPPHNPFLQYGSNYELIKQKNGLCADIFSCAWKHCQYPDPESLPYPYADVPEEKWNLPFAVVHPLSVADIVASIGFAREHGVGMSIKTSGHSYNGASTDRDSLMLNMFRYVKYSDRSILQCSDADVTTSEPAPEGKTITTEDLRSWACKVATSRGKNAIIRVGGGEIWDEVYRAVHHWNNEQDEPLYHVVGGGAGTVGATGGYLGGTGLSGTTGMRMFGYAADQVVQMEMVLPSGDHVRFSPTVWKDDDELAWPRTTKVTGWCNSNPVEDETKWEWGVCPEGIVSFDDLWHAVRGGGNGWGAITSVEYQLQDYPGRLKKPLLYLGTIETYPEPYKLPSAVQDLVQKAWVNFLIDSMWNPSAVNMTEEGSVLCGGPDGGYDSFPNIFGTTAVPFCYADGGQIFSDAWVRVVELYQEELLTAGATKEIVDMVKHYILPGLTGDFQDYAENLLSAGDIPNVPSGRLSDNPHPATEYSFYQDQVVVPIKFLVENRDVSVPWLTAVGSSGFSFSGNYMMGGNIATYHDGTAATGSHYREAAFYSGLSVVTSHVDPTLISAIQKYHANGDGTPSDNFPSMAEFNHFGYNVLGPLKTNWTQPCPGIHEASLEERKEKCIPPMEYIFGTRGLRRLEKIKAEVDPDHLFHSDYNIGYPEENFAKRLPVTLTTKERVSNFLYQALFKFRCYFLLNV